MCAIAMKRLLSFFSNIVLVTALVKQRRSLSCESRIPKTAIFAQESNDAKKAIFIFGLGYVGAALADNLKSEGWKVSGTCTNVPKIQLLRDKGINAYLFDDEAGRMVQPEAICDLIEADCILSTIPPSTISSSYIDAVLAEHSTDLKRAALGGKLSWVGYFSSTGVYGDRNGAWVAETDEIQPENDKTKSRAQAEQAWRGLGSRSGLPMHIFRLSGIYGPGRSAIDTVRKNRGDLALCGTDDKSFISRIHVADIINVVKCSMRNPQPGAVLNLADDLPTTRYEVLSYACKLLNYPLQQPEPLNSRYKSSGALKDNGIRGGSKRVDNSRMLRLLETCGAVLQHPDYRSGLQAILAGGYLSEETFSRGEVYDANQENSESITESENSKIKTLESKIALLASTQQALEVTLSEMSEAIQKLRQLTYDLLADRDSARRRS